jgi:phosphoribosylformimino-5-aminoimidazole carboxamide ribotide isomerase
LIVIPAIDIRAGNCVRLEQGEIDRETVYSDAPERMAVRWVEQGAERLHLVDLDGAVQGKPVNRKTVRKIAESVSVPVQLGGGIRDLATIEAYLELGIDQVILGTAAITHPDLLKTACQSFPGCIIVGLDARGDRVAVQGWTRDTGTTLQDMARTCEHLGVSAIIYTDIQRDGMSTGPNIPSTRALAQSTKVPIIASGGISGIDDVARVADLARDGVVGMITGRALYQKTLDLAEAVRVAKDPESFFP